MIEIMTTSERKLKGKVQHPWSPKLKQAYLEIEFWRTAINAGKRNKCYSKRLNAIREKFNKEVQTTDQTLRNASKQLRKSKKNLRKIAKEASRHRLEFLEQQAEIMAGQGNDEKVKILTRLIRNHRRNGEYQKIKGCLGKINSNGITHIIIPEETDEYPYEPKTIQSWKKEFDPKKLEEKLLQRGREHFSQAQGTPFTEEPLRTMLPFMANSNLAERTLKGKYLKN